LNKENVETYEENDEKLKKLIKEKEDNINFKINSCICLNCYDKFIREREKSNFSDCNENNLLTDALQNILIEFESTDFSIYSVFKLIIKIFELIFLIKFLFFNC